MGEALLTTPILGSSGNTKGVYLLGTKDSNITFTGSSGDYIGICNVPVNIDFNQIKGGPVFVIISFLPITLSSALRAYACYNYSSNSREDVFIHIRQLDVPTIAVGKSFGYHGYDDDDNYQSFRAMFRSGEARFYDRHIASIHLSTNYNGACHLVVSIYAVTTEFFGIST